MAKEFTGTAAGMREQREKLIHDAGELRGPNNTFETDEQRTAFDAMLADAEALGPAIADQERQEKLDTIVRTSLPASQQTEALERSDEAESYRAATLDYIRNGTKMMASESMAILRAGFRTFDQAEKRVMSAIGGAAGGFTVPSDSRFAGLVSQAQLFYGGMQEAGADTISTDTGADLPIPTNDDTANIGSIVSESGSHASGTDLSFGMKIFKSFLYSTKIVLVPWQLLQDSAIDIEQFLATAFGTRLGRIKNTHFTTGTGANQPEGLFQNITTGKQAATGNSTTWPMDNVFDVVHSVDRAYRTARCRWMMRDSTVLALRLSKDGNGRYLWPEMGSVQAGQPMTLAGYPVVVNNDVAAMAASAKAASFGDHSYYKIRSVRGMTFVRLEELYAASGQVGFMAFERADGGYLSGGNPVKAFLNSAS